MTSNPHFALNLTVTIRPNAKPVGWQEDEPVPDDVDYGQRSRITEIGDPEPVAPYGSFEVQGWYWDPTDLIGD
jgi:hypothetical protein